MMQSGRVQLRLPGLERESGCQSGKVAGTREHTGVPGRLTPDSQPVARRPLPVTPGSLLKLLPQALVPPQILAAAS